MYQDLLLREIRKKIGEKSLNEEISTVLNISYDAAHRRTSGKAKFSMDESLELAKNYQISLDQFLGTENQLVVRKTQNIKSTNDLFDYFENSLEILGNISENYCCDVFYSAKDIPFFYTISKNILSKFKFYVWMNLLNQDKFLKPFSEFDVSYYSPQNERLTDIYENQNVHEIWNETTISSLLMQLQFYSDMGLLKKLEMQKIIEDLQILLENIENKLDKKSNYQLYENDLVILNNSFLFTSKNESSYFIPFNMFGYMMTNDVSTCAETRDYFEHQIKNSKHLNTSGNRDKKQFFRKLNQKIDDLIL